MPKRESLEQLKKYPAFQNLRAKAETHALEFRPTESQELEAEGKFQQVIDQRTLAAWNALVDAKAGGANQHEAEEIALPHILLESESEQRDRVLEELEQMESQ